MMFTKSCEYALQSVIYLASQPPDIPIRQFQISQALHIPNHFLGKILQLLTRHGILSSRKGKTGGFLLNGSPEEMSLYRIVQTVDGETFLDDCVLGFPGCRDENPCPVHFEWTSAKREILHMLKEKNIAELSGDLGPMLDYIRLLHNRLQSREK